MSLLLVGISHRTAPITLLDQIASQTDSVAALRKDIAVSPYVAEVMAINTCNRLEVVADV
ncbi:MAG: glutamyl-tRNA reductase, partial [Actinomycetes bacterium]